MWAVAGSLHVTDMRSRWISNSLLAAALGGIVLVGFGAPNASAAQSATVGVAAVSDDEAEMRFLELTELIAQSCAPDLSSPGTDEVAVPSTADTAATDPAPDAITPVLVDEVPLTGDEECAAEKHALRVSRAFSGTDTATYEEMRAKLTGLRYPAARIHRMPDFSGEPVARIDLRVGADHLALEVTGTYLGVMVRAFGAPEGVDVTEVRLEPQLDAPTF